MRHFTLCFTLAALAGAASTDSTAFARFRADSTLAAGFLREARSLDSSAADQHAKARSLDSSAQDQLAKARDRTVQAQTIYDLAVYHLSQDTARTARTAR